MNIKYEILEGKDETNLAYSLMCFVNLLSSGVAWTLSNDLLIEKIVSLVSEAEASSPVMGPALAVITVHALECVRKTSSHWQEIPKLLVTAIANSREFIPTVVGQLLSDDSKVVGICIQLISALLVGLVLPEEGSPSVYTLLRECGLYRNVASCLENRAVSGPWRQQLCDLQEILKAVINKTRKINENYSADPSVLDSFALTQKYSKNFIGTVESSSEIDWERLGLDSDDDHLELFLETCGWAGLLDFNDFLNYDNLNLRKQYLEHSAFAKPEFRFPLVRAAMTISNILYDLFELDGHQLAEELHFGTSPNLLPPSTVGGPPSTAKFPTGIGASSGVESVDKLINELDHLEPLFFEWVTLHFSGVCNFMRIWQSSSAEVEDFDNLTDVVKVLFGKATEQALKNPAFTSIDQVVQQLDLISYDDLRSMQLREIENKINKRWGDDIHTLHKNYFVEAQQFVQEQRIRLLLMGDWFLSEDPTAASNSQLSGPYRQNTMSSRYAGVSGVNGKHLFIALSPSRKSLQFGQYDHVLKDSPPLDHLSRTIDLSSVSKVVITPLGNGAAPNIPKGAKRISLTPRINYTKISLVGNSGSRDKASLVFYCDTSEKAAAWGDGLLILKNKLYQSQDTRKYIEMFAETKLRLQMVNFSAEDIDYPFDENAISQLDSQTVSTDFYYQ